MSVASRSKRIRSSSEEESLEWAIRLNPFARPSPTAGMVDTHPVRYPAPVYDSPVHSPPLQLLSGTTTHNIPTHLSTVPSPGSFGTPLLSTPDLDETSFSPNSESLDFSQSSFDTAPTNPYAATNYYAPTQPDPKQLQPRYAEQSYITIPTLPTHPPSHIPLPPSLHPSPHQSTSPRPLGQPLMSSDGNVIGSGNGYSEAQGGQPHERERSSMPSQTGFIEQTRRGEDIGIGLSDFDMLDTLGTGTFGRVLLAKLRVHAMRPAQTQPHFFALKVLEKVTIVRLRQVEHLNSERSTLAAVEHPFIVNLFCTFHDERNLYLLMEYVQGGELFSHLRRAGRFSSDVARFYAANLILALEYLHEQDIIYRDLKPENLLIDAHGYLKITDFGFAKYVPDRTYTLCGTPEYLAPEIITATGHGRAADYWAYGVLLFELLAGYPPFFDDNPLGIYEKILNGKFGFPSHIDYVAKDLIRRLLMSDLSKRLGNLKEGARGVRSHRWFEGVDWGMVIRKEIKAPIIPATSTPGDTSNFERYPESPLEDLPGPLRAAQAKQYGIDINSIERGPDPYGYLFPAF